AATYGVFITSPSCPVGLFPRRIPNVSSGTRRLADVQRMQREQRNQRAGTGCRCGAPLAIAGVALGGSARERFSLFDPAEVLYAFTGSSHALSQLQAPWARTPRGFRRDRVYLRTLEGIYWTPRYRSLAAMRRELAAF